MTAPPPTGIPVGVMDVGGGHVTAALVDPASVGEVLVERGAAIDPHASRDVLLDQLAAPGRALADAAALAGAGSLRGWSIAMPGPFDAATGTGTFAGVDKFQAIVGVDLRTALADRLGVAPGAVRFVNDAVAYGIGEWAVGAGADSDRMVCITLGTGVGSAFLRDGAAVDSGATVPEQGEVHRLTIGGRPLEETISSPALRRADHERSGRVRSVEELCAAARGGDSAASEVVGAAMSALGGALRPWVERFGATRVVVGGAIARSWDVIAAPLRAGMTPDGRTIAAAAELVPGALGSRAPLIGASVAWTRDAGDERARPGIESVSRLDRSRAPRP